MRTNIEIDDALMARAMKLAGTRTKRDGRSSAKALDLAARAGTSTVGARQASMARRFGLHAPRLIRVRCCRNACNRPSWVPCFKCSPLRWS